MARPSQFTQEIADRICDGLVDGRSLRSICLADDMPAASTVCKWLGQFEAFREQYASARDAQADTLADEIIDIADDGSNDWMERRRDDGSVDEVLNHEHIQRSKLRVDARKWVAAKLKPKKYGERVDVTSGGEKLTNEIDDTARAIRLAALLNGRSQGEEHS